MLSGEAGVLVLLRVDVVLSSGLLGPSTSICVCKVQDVLVVG